MAAGAAEGPAVAEFRVAVRRMSASPRGAIAAVVGGAAMPVVPAEHRAAALAAYAALVLWTVASVRALRRGPAPWVLAGDAVVIGSLCLLQPVIEVPRLLSAECGWVWMVVEATVVTHQWQFRRRPALAVGGVLIAAFVLGASRTGGGDVGSVASMTVWSVATMIVSAAIFASLARTAGRVDEARTVADRERREIDVARAVRDAQAEHLAMLHDTVAATLLMVGTGATGADAELVRRQAGRDLAVLTAPDPGAGTDLGTRLREVVAAGGLTVTLTGAPEAPLPPAAVDAVAGAVGEALRNVARHAGTGTASVDVRPAGAGLRVEVRDGGAGFAPGSGHGHGIRQSIIGRMERCGGSATVSSSPSGVLVTLEWEPSGGGP